MRSTLQKKKNTGFLICVFGLVSFAFAVKSGVAADRTIGVFVALADNQSQGIVPVPKAIGNGEDPEKNLYWGSADGLAEVFDRSREWVLTEKSSMSSTNEVLRMRSYRNEKKQAILTARAYKGSAIKQCIQAYEAAVLSGSYDMVVYIGHNGLMDFDLPVPKRVDRSPSTPDCVVLCCKSEAYFKARIESEGGRPVLLTTQFMYPGAFILHAALGSWLDGKDSKGIRTAAGDAYAKNQKISKKAGTGIFAEIKAKENAEQLPAAARQKAVPLRKE